MMKENKLVQYSIIFMAFVLLAIVLKELAFIFRPLTTAFFITVLLMPIYNFAKKKRIPSSLPIIGIILILSIIGYLLGGLITSEVARFDANSDSYQEQIDGTMNRLTKNKNINFEEFNIKTIISSEKASRLFNSSVTIVGNMFSEGFLAILFVAFMIPTYRKIIETMSYKNTKLRITLKKIQTSAISYLQTKLTISLGTAITSALILTIFQSDFIWTLSIAIFLFNFIPNVGSIFVTIIAAGLYLLKFGMGFHFIALLILLSATQITWGNFIEPKFAGKQLKLSPLLIIISLFFWGFIWGIGGMILSIPMLALLKISLEYFEETKYLAEYLQ